MKDSTKKPVFEPVSAEEAKKIRATAGEDVPPSGLECPSGGDREYDSCYGKNEGDWCCIDLGEKNFGRCRYESGSYSKLKCKGPFILGRKL